LPRSARNDNIIKIEVVGCEAWPMKLWSSTANVLQRSRLRCQERSDVAISNILPIFVRSPRFARDDILFIVEVVRSARLNGKKCRLLIKRTQNMK